MWPCRFGVADSVNKDRRGAKGPGNGNILPWLALFQRREVGRRSSGLVVVVESVKAPRPKFPLQCASAAVTEKCQGQSRTRLQ